MFNKIQGNCFESIPSPIKNLTFENAEKEFSKKNIKLEKSFMKTSGLISEDNIYTNLGLLLSDQCPYRIKSAVFEGTSQDTFKIRREFKGSLFKQLKEISEYLGLYNFIYRDFSTPVSADVGNYPEEALTEILLNMFVHRDYLINADALISIYSDRIEFISIGGLPENITLNDIGMGISICRNSGLSDIFHYLGLTRAYGTGMPKIKNSYENCCHQPVFECSDNVFKIILPGINEYSKEKQKEFENNLCTLIPPQKNNLRKILLDFAETTPSFTRKQAENLLKISPSSCTRLLNEIISENKLLNGGKGKNTFYYSKSIF